MCKLPFYESFQPTLVKCTKTNIFSFQGSVSPDSRTWAVGQRDESETCWKDRGSGTTELDLELMWEETCLLIKHPFTLLPFSQKPNNADMRLAQGDVTTESE